MRLGARTMGWGLLTAALWLAWAGPARAGWLIDPQRFHVSAHGEQSCLDCHQGKAAQKPHPDPGKVNRSLKAIFRPQHCYECHDSVEEELAKGRHGGRKVDDASSHLYCLQCHNPHYQPKLKGEHAGKLAKGVPLGRQCGACHQPKAALPPVASAARRCFGCHRGPVEGDPQATVKIAAFCYQCHGRFAELKGKWPALDMVAFWGGPHRRNTCLQCHRGGAGFDHGKQPAVNCLTCHQRHGAGKAFDPHLTVQCAACHQQGLVAKRRAGDKSVIAVSLAKTGVLSEVHGQVDTSREESCRRCHRPGNRVGAAAMVLPAKGIACMPCHIATWSRGDDFSFAGLIIFGLGLLGALSFWFSGATGGLLAAGQPQSLGSKLGEVGRQTLRAVFSRRILAILKVLLLDGLLQRRLWRLSPLRGLIHNLIFLPFALRFTWGLVALIASENAPGAAWPWLLVDKNAPLTALVFDISGLMVLLGAGAAVARRLTGRSMAQPPSGLPRPDWLAMGLLAAIVLVGFVLEAMRIALTGAPPGADWAFAGYALSGLFSPGAGLAAAYGYIWYIHAILTGAFVAYLPFSRMFHIVLAPVVLAAGAALETEHPQH